MTKRKTTTGTDGKKWTNALGLWIAVGAGIGLTFGVIFGQIALGMAIGAGLGVVVGAIVAGQGPTRQPDQSSDK
jgi:hypothetical protein